MFLIPKFVSYTMIVLLDKIGKEQAVIVTYITGALMMQTAFHSSVFKGRMENSVWRTGV